MANTSGVPTAVAAPERENPGGVLPWAVAINGDEYDASVEFPERVAPLSSGLEAFGQSFVTVASDTGNGFERVRTYLVTATVPGLQEKIPVYGMKETRAKVNSKIVEYKIETFVFYGQERVKVGRAFYALNADNSFCEFRLLTNEGNHMLLTGNLVNGIPQFYDVKGDSLFTYIKGRNKKSRLVYEAREVSSRNKLFATLKISYESAWGSKRKLKEMDIEFHETIDPTIKPLVVMSSFMLLYSLRFT